MFVSPLRRIGFLVSILMAILAWRAWAPVAWVPRTTAAPPWSALLPFKRVDADPKKAYKLTEDNGPWMVYAMSFSGEQAEQLARELVLEIRRDLKLPAYVFDQRFDYRQRLEGMGYDVGPDNQLQTPQMRYLHEGEIKEYAVLVGDFESLDDPNVAKTLKTLKAAKPRCLAEEIQDGSYHHLASLRQASLAERNVKSTKGPLGNAFGTRNPLIPQEYFKPKGPDKLVIQMNRDVEYSLLKNKGKYTIRIARFRGQRIIDQKMIAERERSGKVSQQLIAAAEKAHDLTTALRKQGVDAYEFHDRTESIVTVGSFDSLGHSQLNGQFQLNPAVEAMLKKFGPQMRDTANFGSTPVPRVIQGIALEVQPEPIEVPKVSIATAYAR